MGAIFGSIAVNLFEAAVLAAAALAGVICGRKFRDRNDAKKAAKSAGETGKD